MHRPHAVDQHPRRHLLQDHAARAEAHHRLQARLVGEGGEDHDLRRHAQRRQPLEDPRGVVVREREVEHQHVGPVPLHGGERRERRRRPPDDVHVGFEAEDLFESVEHDRVIVGEHEARHTGTPRKGTLISIRAPRRLDSIASEPPSVATRCVRLRGPMSR